MANLILTNNSSQVECTISQSYCRLTGSYAGPLNASAQSNSGFLIQNGNKQSGLFVGNTCTTFYNNCLSFDPANTDVNLNIPNTRSFIITGNNSLLTFNADGTLAVGAAIDTNYKGMQVVNTSPIFLLKDTDALNHSGNQALSFFDSTGAFSASFCNEPSSSINTGSAITDNATAIVYNKYFRLRNNPSNGSVNTLIACGNNLTLFSGDCLNRSFNLAIGGTSYFACDLFSSGTINTSGLCVLSNNSFLRGSGDAVAFNICNNRSNSSGAINFYNPSGGLHSSILSTQNSGLGCSEIDFYVTPTGAYNSTNRNQLALEIKGDRSVIFYGNISGQTGFYNSYLQSNEFRNSGSRTFLNTGSNGLHCFLLHDSGNIYSYASSNNCITNHIWYVSGNNIAMCLDCSGNASVTGSIFSHSGICSTGSLCISNQNLDSCIRSRCVVISGTNNSCNILLYGNVCSAGSFENNSTTGARFFGICSTGNSDNIISGLLRTCSSICSTGSICSLSSIQSSAFGIFHQGVCSNGEIYVQGIAAFNTIILVTGRGPSKSCFCNSVDVCGSVSANNTAKAWGIYGLNNTSTPTLTGLNIKSINIYQNATPLVYAYGICFNTAVRYPFVVNFDVYSSGNALITGNNSNIQGGQSLGFSGTSATNVNLGNSNSTVTYPFSVQFYALSGKRAIDNTLAAYTAGTTYSEIYFNLANQKGPTTTYSDLTKANANGIIHFSIFGQ